MAFTIKRILLAEDDPVTAHLTKVQLEQQGFVVTVAVNGLEALNIIRSRPIDLLITDVVMPEMDGVDLYLELKKHPITAMLPVIIITDKQVFQESFAALGVQYFVSKMSDSEVLLHKIYEVGAAGSDVTEYRKVLIYGQDEDTTSKMQALLIARFCLVTVVRDPMEVGHKALLMTPHIILLEVMPHGDVATAEVIRSLRCFRRLDHAVILTYAGEPSNHREDWDRLRLELDSSVKSCEAAGAVKYLGHFAKGSFVLSLNPFGLK